MVHDTQPRVRKHDGTRVAAPGAQVGAMKLAANNISATVEATAGIVEQNRAVALLKREPEPWTFPMRPHTRAQSDLPKGGAFGAYSPPIREAKLKNPVKERKLGTSL